jgi:hypothetical protein
VRPGYASEFAFSRTIAGAAGDAHFMGDRFMAINTPSTTAKPGPYQDLGARANLSDQVVTAIAVSLGVVVVALVAVLMGMA